MIGRFGKIAIALLAAAMASACAPGGETRLMNLSAGATAPDEFAIVPPKPLEIPEDLATLPPPEPGGTNRTDRNPQAEIIVALGGDPARGVRDPALLALARGAGAEADVRSALAAEDEAYRRANPPRLLERLVGSNVYFRAYGAQSLDAEAERLRWLRLGVRTPPAPPPALR
jgi:hypothetical protein